MLFHDRKRSSNATPRSTSTISLRRKLLIITLLISTAFCAGGVVAEENYTLFESDQVRPMAMSADGNILYAVNTPDNRLEAFQIKDGGLEPIGSVLVGVEPVAVAVANDGKVWVVNHVSDSVSIVNASNPAKMSIVDTLLVGDEPRDIVFAGSNKSRAFITTAHRGQNSPVPLEDFTTPGIGRADVWVFDTSDLGSAMGGEPITIISLFTDTPRALAVSSDGKQVYAAGFKTGNKTTTILEMIVTPEGGVPGADNLVDMNGDGIPEPHIADANGVLQPLTSLIVKYRNGHWRDETGKIWDDQVKFNLPDKDVFVIDANADIPAVKAGNDGYRTGVGTVLFNMAVNPVNGKIYVTNTEARNDVRFEGEGGLGSTVRGHFAESRITVIDNNAVLPRHLNKHIDYSKCCKNNTDEKAAALAQPMEMAISSDGKKLYVAAFGSNKVGIFDTAKLEDNSFQPNSADQVEVAGGGPSGVVLDEKRNQLYVLTRFDSGISIINTVDKKRVAHITMHNPEPAHIREGRKYHYDANLTSSHGDSSCALCHVFGDMDQLAWDLGNPDGSPLPNYAPLAIDHQDFGFPAEISTFMNMKGPMTTQSMKGMANHGAQHWRGDRTGADGFTESKQPDSGVYDEQAAFKAFNPAFTGLIGRETQLSDEAMQDYTNFALELTYPPNPIRNLDNSLEPAQQAGRDFFMNPDMIVDTVHHCNGCHVLDRDANKNKTNKPGFFGTDGKNTFAFQTQFFKVPHLRNLYQKVGMFGMANNNNFLADDWWTGLDPENMTMEEMQNHMFFGNENPYQGDQIRGFGMFHDGSVDTIFRFHNIIGFLPRPAQAVTPLDPGNPANLDISMEGMQIRRNLEQWLLVFDTNLFPIVGQQITLTANNGDTVGNRVDLMIQRADLGECDLIASHNGRGYLYQGKGKFDSDIKQERDIAEADVRSLAQNGSITYTCTPPGNGPRLALDRDMDGVYNGDEIAAGTDPADPNS
jgi:DNA-binding beta-propeller fold protein YncE